MYHDRETSNFGKGLFPAAVDIIYTGIYLYCKYYLYKGYSSTVDIIYTVNIKTHVMNFEFETSRTKERDLHAHKQAFDYYDWNKSGTISVKVDIRQ